MSIEQLSLIYAIILILYGPSHCGLTAHIIRVLAWKFISANCSILPLIYFKGIWENLLSGHIGDGSCLKVERQNSPLLSPLLLSSSSPQSPPLPCARKIRVQYADSAILSCIGIGNRDRLPIINPDYANAYNQIFYWGYSHIIWKHFIQELTSHVAIRGDTGQLPLPNCLLPPQTNLFNNFLTSFCDECTLRMSQVGYKTNILLAPLAALFYTLFSKWWHCFPLFLPYPFPPPLPLFSSLTPFLLPYPFDPPLPLSSSLPFYRASAYCCWRAILI